VPPSTDSNPSNFRRVVFALAAIACATPWASGPIALFAGIALSLAGLSAFEGHAKKVSKILVQCCVVLLGLRLNLSQLAGAALDGIVFAVATIGGAFALGWGLSRLLRIGGELGTLVNAGTAICGASAIAAVGSSIAAAPASMAVATGAIFVLNAVGLSVLPMIGHALNLTDVQFGTWAGVALHDVASVASAASHYHATGDTQTNVALDTANVVKMTRVLWILPIALLARKYLRPAGSTATKSPFPWFILWFIAASGVRSIWPQLAGTETTTRAIAACGFQIALFLIGSGLSTKALKAVGWRVFVHATILWLAVAGASLAAIVFLQ
jgi:uncharacterized integral membrane protein (TIGR00698 family)